MNTLINFIYKYGIFAMCFIILIEYACFPVSSEIVLPLSGAVAKLNNTSFFVLLPLSVLSGMLGSSICFFIGKFFGEKVITTISSKFPKTKKSLNTSYSFFDKYGNKAVCIGRLIPLCRTYISFVAGALKMPASKFFLFSSIGITVWNFCLIGLGYILGNNWTHAVNFYSKYKNFLLIIIITIFLSLLISKYINKTYKQK